MAIILQTMITNKLNQDRKVRWAGARGLHLPGNKAVIVEGAYPTACNNAQAARQLAEEVRQGWVELTLITNLNVAEPVGGAGAVKNPDAVKQNAAKKQEADVETTKVDLKNEERFVKKEEAEGTLAPETKQLPGTEDQTIPEPVTKEMFPDGPTVEQKAAEEAKEEPVKEEAKEESPAPAKEEPAKEEAKAPAKKRTRRKKADDTENK